jgi:hypothetical protein
VVAKAQDYAWSSDRQYRREKELRWLDVDRLLGMLGRGRSAAVLGYRKLMREELEEPYEKVESWGQAVKGDEIPRYKTDPIFLVAACRKRREGSKALPPRKQRPGRSC